MVLNATHPITLASGIPHDSSKISVKRCPQRYIKNWLAVFRAEDHMDKQKCKRLRHLADYKSTHRPLRSVPNRLQQNTIYQPPTSAKGGLLYPLPTSTNTGLLYPLTTSTNHRLPNHPQNSANGALPYQPGATPQVSAHTSPRAVGPTYSLATAAMLLLALAPAHAQSPQPPKPSQLTIKIINARTNQPIIDERLNVALRAEQIGSVQLATDKTGIILVDYGTATTIRILSNMYADCRPRGELYTDYAISDILTSGITTGNLCSNAKPKPTPGTLTLYETPKTFIRNYPAPPNTNLPHSDENPHQAPN
jgi:hypothetical protein